MREKIRLVGVSIFDSYLIFPHFNEYLFAKDQTFVAQYIKL
jgi:hypothetical protein